MQGTVYFIDDDSAVLDALAALAKSRELTALPFSSAEEFLDCGHIESPGCIVADLKMPGISGLQLQERLLERSIRIPLIMISGYAEVSSAVLAMQRGAIDFITKPFDAANLFDQIQECIERDRKRLDADRRLAEDRERIESLTGRERQVFERLVRGYSGKQIAFELGISYRTMEKFRANVMRKTEADGVVDLAYLAVRLQMRTEQNGSAVGRV
jgi:FixJ family two-component response regulator